MTIRALFPVWGIVTGGQSPRHADWHAQENGMMELALGIPRKTRA